MGKRNCETCKKKCKGHAVRLQDKYFHIKCFKCKACEKQLLNISFFTKDNNFYCKEDYEKLFAARCLVCHQVVEGEIVTALNNTYHPQCLTCTTCKKPFSQGEKVSLTGEVYWCNACLEDAMVKAKIQTEQLTPKKSQIDNDGHQVTEQSLAPNNNEIHRPSKMSPLKADHEIVPTVNGSLQSPAPHTRPGALIADDHLGSPTSDISDVSYTKDTLANPDFDNSLIPDASDKSDDGIDVDESMNVDKSAISPMQNIMQYRSPSPASVSRSSKHSRESVGSGALKSDSVYGRALQPSYLDKQTDFKKGPSINLISNSKPSHFHRPENFSYSKGRRELFVLPVKKADQNHIAHKKIGPPSPLNNKEVIEESRFPAAHRVEQSGLSPMERDDWPGPPLTAAAYPELLRDHSGRRSRPRSRLTDESGEGPLTVHVDDEDTDSALAPVSPKVQREIDTLAKMKDSGTAQVILKDLQQKAQAEPVALDPRSASRTPSANHEPAYKTRYESPMFASPSRLLDTRPRSMDDEALIRRYRTSTLPIANLPVEKRLYETPKSLVVNVRAPRPGYGLASRTLPTSAKEFPSPDDSRSGIMSPDSETHDKQYTSQSSLEEDGYDPHTGLRRGPRLRPLSVEQLPAFRRSMPSVFKVEEPPRIYPYERLVVKHFQLPPDVDRTCLERHLSRDEFDSLFHMSRREFYRLAEWKQNDLKKRVGLY